MITLIANVRIHKQDRSGNTYHSVQIIDIKTDSVIASEEKKYGYGEQYKVTAASLIKSALPKLAKRIAKFEDDKMTFDNWRVAKAVKDAKILKVIYIKHEY